MSPSTLVRALALSCHPIPSLAVTALTAGLAALADLSLGRAALVTAAVFTGQLSIGWSNDYLDAGRDRAVRRTDKPVAAGVVAPRVAGVAALVALIVTLALSAGLGWPGGGAALVTVACGWAYNLGLKATALSWLPYAIAFGMLPAVVTLSASPPRWPAPWALAAGTEEDHRRCGEQDPCAGQCGGLGAQPVRQAPDPGGGVLAQVRKRVCQMRGHA